MKRFSLVTSFAFAVAALTVTLAAAGTSAQRTVVIRHATAHCHVWSFDHGKPAAAISGTVAKGGTLIVANYDVMPHKLFEKTGPAATFKGSSLLNKMGASVTLKFPKAGTYVFGTKAGEDYTAGVKTTGEDNVLTLKITVK